MKTKLKTLSVSGNRQIRDFFDQIAENYQDRHGQSERLLSYRLSVITPLLGRNRNTLLEIGCGTGIHLFRLAGFYQRAIGTDLSPKMIKVALEQRASLPNANTIALHTDPAEQLSSINDRSIDTVLCVGAFEHMTDKQQVLTQIQRVLKPGGEFICLTPNGDYCWYRSIARCLQIDTRHLSSDRFLSKTEIAELVGISGLGLQKIGYWRFIPKGDIPDLIYALLSLLDMTGRLLKTTTFRGGIYFKAVKAAL